MELRIRENMDTLLIANGELVARIKDPRYEALLGNSDRLREQLYAATFVLDNLPDVDIDTSVFHDVLAETKFE